MALNARQKLFVKHYLKNKNATQAAKDAGYSKATAYSIGDENLKKPEIKAAIEAGLEKQLARAELTGDMIIAELRKLAFVNLSGAYGPDGKLLPIHQMPEDVQLAISSMESDEIFAGPMKIGETKKLKLIDKVRCLENLGKHFKLFTDVIESKNETKVEVVTPEMAKETYKKIKNDC